MCRRTRLQGVGSSFILDRRKETAALISQNRRIVSDTGKRTKSSARQRFFLFPAVEADVSY